MSFFLFYVKRRSNLSVQPSTKKVTESVQSLLNASVHVAPNLQRLNIVSLLCPWLTWNEQKAKV